MSRRTDMTDIPPRVVAAEQRAKFRRMLDASSLGDPEVQAAIERGRRVAEALPEPWTQLSRPDLIRLLELYWHRREVWADDHEMAVECVLAEVDFEPSQDDMIEINAKEEV